MRVLDLFCGTKSIANVAQELGHDVFTIDNDPQHEPDLCVDLLEAEPVWVGSPKSYICFPRHNIEISRGDFDMVWASPPCTCFSIAGISHNWEQTEGGYKPRHERAVEAVRLVEQTEDIIGALQPCVWFIENPRGLLRKLPVMQGLPRHTVTYCQYGDKRMKPTDIWTNCTTWQPKPMCKNGDPCHERAPRGSKTGTQGLKGSIERSRMPQELCIEVILAAEKQIEEAK